MKRHKTMTRKELESFFKDDISKYDFNFKMDFSEDEENIAELVEEELKIELKRFPMVNYPEEINTPDYASPKSKIVIEIKSPSSFRRGIEDTLRKSIKQTKLMNADIRCVTILNIDKLLENSSEDEVIEAILRRFFSLQLQYLFIIKDGALIRVAHMLKRS